MTTITEIIQRVREKLAGNQDMPGNNCLIYFDALSVRGNIYHGNVMAARVGSEHGPWKARIYLRLELDCTAATQDASLSGLEQLFAEWSSEPDGREEETRD